MKTKCFLTILAIISILNMADAQNANQTIEVATDFTNKIPINIFIGTDVSDYDGSGSAQGNLSFDLSLPNGVLLDYVYANHVKSKVGYDYEWTQSYDNIDGRFVYNKENNVYHITIRHTITFPEGSINNQHKDKLHSNAQNRASSYQNNQIILGLNVSKNFTRGLVKVYSIEDISYDYFSGMGEPELNTQSQSNITFYIEKTDNPIVSYVAKNHHESSEKYEASGYDNATGELYENEYETNKIENSLVFYYDEKKEFRIDSSSSSSHYYYESDYPYRRKQSWTESEYSTDVLSFTDDDPVWRNNNFGNYIPVDPDYFQV